MAVSDLPKVVRNAGRFNQVVAVALKYGIASWLSGVKADWVQRQLRSHDGQAIGDLPEAVRVRMALAHRDASDRGAAIETAMRDYLSDRLVAHGFKGDSDAIRAVIDIDVVLNAAGLVSWLERLDRGRK